MHCTLKSTNTERQRRREKKRSKCKSSIRIRMLVSRFTTYLPMSCVPEHENASPALTSSSLACSNRSNVTPSKYQCNRTACLAINTIMNYKHECPTRRDQALLICFKSTKRSDVSIHQSVQGRGTREIIEIDTRQSWPVCALISDRHTIVAQKGPSMSMRQCSMMYVQNDLLSMRVNRGGPAL